MQVKGLLALTLWSLLFGSQTQASNDSWLIKTRSASRATETFASRGLKAESLFGPWL